MLHLVKLHRGRMESSSQQLWGNGDGAKMEIRFLWKEKPAANRERKWACVLGDYHLTVEEKHSILKS